MSKSIRPVLIMMVGLPGSGKTHWINEQLKKTENGLFGEDREWSRISTDDILEEFMSAHGIDYKEAHNRYIKDAFSEMNRRLVDALHAGRDIIWDQTNVNSYGRRRKLSEYASMFDEGGYIKIAVVMDPDAETLHERQRLSGKNTPPSVLKEMSLNFTYPTNDEGFDYITTIPTKRDF